jgi:putative two-component system response regulator
VSNRILVVDDEPVNVALVKAILANVSDEIRGVTDSTEAAVAFVEFRPDLVLLDLRMPPPDGLDLLRLWRTERERQGFLPVIVLTGDDRDTTRNTALLLGANDFLVKPLDRPEVVLRARNLLHTRHLFEELKRLRSEDSKSS